MNRRSPMMTGVLITVSVLGMLVALWLLVRLRSLVALLLIAFVMAAGIEPMVASMQQWRLPRSSWRLPRGLCALVILLAAVLAVGGIAVFIGSVAWREGTQLWAHVPGYLDAARTWLAGLRRQYPDLPALDNTVGSLQGRMASIGGYAWQTAVALFGVLGGLFSMLSVLVLAFYMVQEKPAIGRAVLEMVSVDRREAVGNALSEAGQKVGGWLRGQLLLALIILVTVSAAMWALGVPYPILLGVIAGTAELIPMLGPFVSGLIAVPVAYLTKPTWVFLAVLGFFLALSQVEGNWLSPRIMRSQVGLSPLTTIIALLAGGALLGMVGALLAVPLAAGLRVLVLRLVIPPIHRSAREEASERHAA